MSAPQPSTPGRAVNNQEPLCDNLRHAALSDKDHATQFPRGVIMKGFVRDMEVLTVTKAECHQVLCTANTAGLLSWLYQRRKKS